MVPFTNRLPPRKIRWEKSGKHVRPVAHGTPAVRIALWEVSIKCEQADLLDHAGVDHSNELWRALVKTWVGWIPRIALATAAERLGRDS